MANALLDYLKDQRNGLIRTGLFVVAWGTALFAAMAADSTDQDLKHYDFQAYEHNLSSLAWLMLGSFGVDLILYIMNRCGCVDVWLDMFRELAIIGTGCLALIGFVAGMVKLDGQHAAQVSDGRLYWTAVATYSFLASSILASARLRNIDMEDQEKYLRKEAIKESSVGERYNKVPQVEAHNFY
jgi:hypothetical protein